MVWIDFKVLPLHINVKCAIELLSGYFAKNKDSPKFANSNQAYFAA